VKVRKKNEYDVAVLPGCEDHREGTTGIGKNISNTDGRAYWNLVWSELSDI